LAGTGWYFSLPPHDPGDLERRSDPDRTGQFVYQHFAQPVGQRPDLTEAIQASKAEAYYICNVATQRGETDGFNASDHVTVLEQHIQKRIFSLVLCNRNFKGELGHDTDWVVADQELHEKYRVYECDLVDDLYPWRHSSKKLAKTIMNLYEERTGPLN
jgi:hypothetical protein